MHIYYPVFNPHPTPSPHTAHPHHPTESMLTIKMFNYVILYF